jgi:hypothetical protein
VGDFFRLLTIYYQVDAGSYTADAGGTSSLDTLFAADRETGRFAFDRTEGRLAFNARAEMLFAALEAAVHTAGGAPASPLARAGQAIAGRLRRLFGGPDPAPTPIAGGRYHLNHIPYRGLEHVPGQTTHVGNLATVSFRPKGASDSVTATGRVIEDFPAGLTLLDDSGVMHRFSANDGAILSLVVEPVAVTWSKRENIRELVDSLRRASQPQYAILALSYPERLLVGAIRLEGGIISLTDAGGMRHELDPDLVSGRAYLTERPIDFIGSGTTSPVIVRDRRRPEREALTRDLMAAGGSVYDNPSYYDYLSGDPDDTRALISRWYRGDLADRVSQRLGDRFVPILADPGVANRAGALIDFASSWLPSNPDADVWQLRQAFSDFLGTETVYRGMVLTEAQARAMIASGIRAPGFQVPARAERSISESIQSDHRYDHVDYPRSPTAEIHARLTDFYDQGARMTMSVSRYSEIAASAGYHSSGHAGERGRQLYLFEIELPVLSLIEQTNLFGNERHEGPEILLRVGDEFTASETGDLGVEMFVPHRIPPDAIRNVTRYDQEPPAWRRERRRG